MKIIYEGLIEFEFLKVPPTFAEGQFGSLVQRSVLKAQGRGKLSPCCWTKKLCEKQDKNLVGLSSVPFFFASRYSVTGSTNSGGEKSLLTYLS